MPPAQVRISFASEEKGYQHRGETLSLWPLYFYVAGVSRISRSKAVAGQNTISFEHAHPQHKHWAQQILTTRPWYVPQLVGPKIPSKWGQCRN